MTRQSKIGLCLFGFNREEVDKHLEKIRDNNQESIDEIKTRIQSLKDENDKMIKEIECLKEESKIQLEPEDFMKFSLDRCEEWIPLINNVSSDKVREVTLMMESQQEIFNKKISEFDEIIKNTQEQLDKLLRNVLQKNESFSENLKMFIEQKGPHNVSKSNVDYEVINEDDIEKVSNIKAKANGDIIDITTQKEYFENDLSQYINVG
jgi:exonuclease VII large subunit